MSSKHDQCCIELSIFFFKIFHSMSSNPLNKTWNLVALDICSGDQTAPF